MHVSIEDTGSGIDPANMGRIFQPLFTTKARGMGMGLSICRSIIVGDQTGRDVLGVKQNKGRSRIKVLIALLVTLATQAGKLQAQTFGPGTIVPVSITSGSGLLVGRTTIAPAVGLSCRLHATGTVL